MRERFTPLLKDTRGNVLIIAALALPVVVGFAGIATDTVQWSHDKRELQRAADSAALAGAYTIAQDGDPIQSAKNSIAANNSVPLNGEPTLENAPTSGDFAGNNNAIFVELESNSKLPFSSLFLPSGASIKASSTAAVISKGDYCAISLDDSSDVGVEATGSAYVDLKCGIFSNSRGRNAVSVGGASSVITNVVGGVGGLSPSPGYDPNVVLLPYSAPQPDPFEALPEPAPSGCAGEVRVNPAESRTLSPGCYRGMNLRGTVDFDPGVYYIDRGSLSFGSQVVATGAGVTFILTSSTASSNPGSIANLLISGGATLDFSSPETGTYAGVLFFQDRRARRGLTSIHGNSATVLEGAFYFPTQTIEFSSNSGMTTDCIQLIGFKITFTGNSTISNVCPPAGASSFGGKVIRLVS